MFRHAKSLLSLILGAAILTGCATKNTQVTPGLWQNTPAPTPIQIERSKELSKYYRQIERDLLTRGLLRRDGGNHDTPLSAPQLAKNFERIALRKEYIRRNGHLIASETDTQLLRWRDPIHISLEFGPSVPQKIRHQDQEVMDHYARRLSRVSGHPISMTTQNANFSVFVVNDFERESLGYALRQTAPNIDDVSLNAVTQMPQDTYCLVIAMAPNNHGEINQAIAVIRAEHPSLMRASCLHEEVAQGLGLSNDHPEVRPSIFNDDEEFGLLTTHDEMLLKILYDPRLTPGQNADDARETVAIIAHDLIQN